MRLQEIISRAKSLQEAANIEAIANREWSDMRDNLTPAQCRAIVRDRAKLVKHILGATNETGDRLYDEATANSVADFMTKHYDRYQNTEDQE